MVSSTINSESFEVIDRPSVYHRAGAVLLPLLGVLVGSWLIYRYANPVAESFRCDRSTGQCEIDIKGRRTTMPLAELADVDVKQTSRSKQGTHYQLDIVVAGADKRRDLGRATTDDRTEAEYRQAAATIKAFLAGSERTLAVSWVYRVGFGETLRPVLFAGFLVIAGIALLALWARRTTVVDRKAQVARVTRSRPLRGAVRRDIPFAEISDVRQRTNRGRVTIELVLPRETWTIIAHEPERRPGLAQARSALEQAFGRTIKAG